MSQTITSTISSSTTLTLSSRAAPKMSTLPQLSGKYRKSKINNDNPENEFMQATVDTLKATIAKKRPRVKET